MADPPVHFIVPGPIAQRTGGYGYDRRIVDQLRALGRAVEIVELEGTFPFCCDTAKASAGAALTAIPDGAVAVIDGLALPAFEHALSPHRGRVQLVALIHHPLALETGLSDGQRTHLAAVEGALIGQVNGVVVTSPATADLLPGQELDAGAISVVLPGTDPAPRAKGSAGPAVQLLCVEIGRAHV